MTSFLKIKDEYFSKYLSMYYPAVDHIVKVNDHAVGMVNYNYGKDLLTIYFKDESYGPWQVDVLSPEMDWRVFKVAEVVINT